jgi:hypothetical protein
MDTTQKHSNGRKHKLPADLQILCERWFMRYVDMLSGALSELLPLREINHRIPLIDDQKRYHYHLPRCPKAMKPQLMEKLQQYMDVGWWRLKTMLQAAPLLCILKKMGKL